MLENDINLDGDTLSRLMNEEHIDKLKMVTENTSDVICLHHPSDARYLYASPSAERIIGYTSKDLEGKVPSDFIHPEHLEILSTNLEGQQKNVVILCLKSSNYFSGKKTTAMKGLKGIANQSITEKVK